MWDWHVGNKGLLIDWLSWLTDWQLMTTDWPGKIYFNDSLPFRYVLPHATTSRVLLRRFQSLKDPENKNTVCSKTVTLKAGEMYELEMEKYQYGVERALTQLWQCTVRLRVRRRRGQYVAKQTDIIEEAQEASQPVTVQWQTSTETRKFHRSHQRQRKTGKTPTQRWETSSSTLAITWWQQKDSFGGCSSTDGSSSSGGSIRGSSSSGSSSTVVIYKVKKVVINYFLTAFSKCSVYCLVISYLLTIYVYCYCGN